MVKKVRAKIHHLNGNSLRGFRATFISTGKMADFKSLKVLLNVKLRNSHINCLGNTICFPPIKLFLSVSIKNFELGHGIPSCNINLFCNEQLITKLSQSVFKNLL